MRAPARHTTAIVVGMQDYSESDRIVRLLSPEHGRVSALARRARASRRRFGGSLDLGNKVEVALRPGRGDLWHLDGATLVDGRRGTRRDYDRVSLLMYACEACAILAREAHPEPRLYGLLDMASLLLDASTTPPTTLWRLGLEAKILSFAGFAPVLGRCVACDQALSEPAVLRRWSAEAAHAGCSDEGLPVSLDWLSAVEGARRQPLRESLDRPCPPGPAGALADTIEAQAGRRLRARAVLASGFDAG